MGGVMNKIRLPPIIRDELDGIAWTIEPGRRHWQLRIAGRLVAILPHGTVSEASPKAWLAIRSNIRRHMRRAP